MKKFLLLTLLGLLSLGFIHAQHSAPRLYINNTRVLPKKVEVDYDITYGGFVEIHLFDQDNKKVWIKGKVCKKLGPYTFTIPSKSLKSGERYSYYFRYKGEEYQGSFYAG